ncbi:MAG: hypothetical protein K940chlam3_00596 [Chlamydiae bacterium]|nr:hypothetical protein [Chlamydiota bacterium]
MESTSATKPVDRFNEYYIEQCDKELLGCSVCLEGLKNPHMIILCQHVFCQACIAQCVNHADAATCPECRKPFKAEELQYSFRENTRLESLWNECKGTFKKRSRKTCRKECKKEYEDEHEMYYKTHYKKYYKLGKLNNPNSNPTESYPLVDIKFPDAPVVTPTPAPTPSEPERHYRDVYERIKRSMESYHGEGKHYHTAIDARDGVTLYNCIVDNYINSSMGHISVTDCPSLQNIKARDGVNIENSAARYVKCSMGTVSVSNSQVDEIDARDGITIRDFHANRLKVSMGCINARNSISKVSSIKSRDGANLRNVTADEVTVSMGNAIVKGQSDRVKFDRIKARDGVEVYNAQVTNEVESSMGPVSAELSEISKISAQSKVFLTGSSAGVIHLKGKESKAKIVLRDSVVEGNVIVTAPKSFSGIDGINYRSMARFCTGMVIINGVVIDPSAPPSSSDEPSHVNLTIEGKGHIKGKIIFDDCEGTIRCGDDIIVDG